MSLEISTGGIEGLAKIDARPANFAAMAAHEMRSPLRSLRIYLETLNSQYGDGIDEQALELVSRSMQVVEKMQKLLEGILDCALLEHRPGPKPFVEMDQLLENVVSGLQEEIKATQTVVNSKGLPVVRYNPEQLATIFTNLIRNAIQYRSANAPQIDIYAQRMNDQYIIFVADNGVGIKPEHLKLVFEPFSQLERLKGSSQIGLGLYICKSIIDRNGGHIDVHSVIGRGSEFSFSIKVGDNE